MSDSSGHISLEASAPYRPGMLVGSKFVLLRLIAEGAVGVVYEAKDELIQRHVAIKLLHAYHVHNPEMVRRFRREAEATATVQHPNVVTVFEMGQRRDGSFFIVQELLQGKDLRAHLAERRRLSVDEALGVMLPIISALVAAHANGIVHRDVKPENIVLAQSASGELVPKLIDFGIAKLSPGASAPNITQVGALLGTASYMSPEQVRGLQPVDIRADVWAVGAVLYELLSGVKPYDGPNPQSIIAKILTEPVPPLETVARGMPARLAAIIHRALERDISARYPSMQALRDDLRAFGGRPVPLFGPVPQPTTARAAAAQRRRALSAEAARQGGSFGAYDPRRAAFATTGEAWLDPDDLVPDEQANEGAASHDGRADMPPSRAPVMGWAHEGATRRAASPDPGVDADSGTRAPPSLEAAEHALSVNRLEEAIALADGALQDDARSGFFAGRALLVQAIAYRWLGDYAAAEQRARDALAELPHAGGAWYAALGHVVIASGHLGNRKRLLSILEDVKRLDPTAATASIHALLLCRLSIFLLRCGLHNVAQKLYLDAHELAPHEHAHDVVVRAWLDASRAELDMYRGDLGSYLRRIEAAVEGFTAAGDLRNACRERCNIGNAFLQFGAYRRAAAVLRETLAVAEPMKLDFVASVRANLGFALAQLGDFDEAFEVTRVALEHCIRQRDKRSEGFTRIYLATMRWMRGEHDLATAAARDAVAMLEGATAIRAYALATLGNLLLEQREAASALRCAQESMDILHKLSGVEEGESLIRTVYALALRATGREADGRRHIADARKRLIERADRIKDPQWRQSFLERVPDNARLLHVATQWLDQGAPASSRWTQ